MISVFVSGAAAVLASGLGTPFLIRWLTKRGIGEKIRDDGPQRHVTKAGTPTMGGVALVGAAIVGYAVAHVIDGTNFSAGGMLVILVMVCSAAVGMADDWIKVRRQRSLGLNKRTKLAAQLLVALGFAVIALEFAGARTTLSFTRYNSPGIELGAVSWVIWAALLIIGSPTRSTSQMG